MAVIHRATLVPTKIQLLQAWLPGRPWGTAGVVQIGAYRFDDPAGEVGVETLLLRSDDGRVLQVPLTYRAAPLPGIDDALIGTTEHSALGTRWVYDGCADPVWFGTVATAILTGGTEAEEVFTDGERREPQTTVRGSGSSSAVVKTPAATTVRDEGDTTVVSSVGIEVVLARVVGVDIPGHDTLSGTWAGGEAVVLAAARRTTD